jgi:maleylacetate reductase
MLIEPFVHQLRSVRVLFGSGSLEHVPDEVDRLGLRRLVVIGSSSRLDRVQALLGDRVAIVVDNPVMHVPVEQVDGLDRRALDAAVDGVLAVGGGSAVGLAKAFALRRRVPVIAVPTTFSGSEMTRVWGITQNGVKTTGRDEIVAPGTVIYDPDLLATFGARRAVPSAFNAIAHAVEALYAPDRTPVTDMYALHGIELMTGVIGAMSAGETDTVSTALYAAWLCGMCLDGTAMALHHKLCHALGGTLGLPHAEIHTAVLPHVLAFNGPAVPAAMNKLRSRLGVADPANYLLGLAENNGATMALSSLGMAAEDVATIAEIVLRSPYANPRPINADDLTGILHQALVGAPAVSEPAALKAKLI